MTNAAPVPQNRPIPPRKRLTQRRRVKTMEDLRAACRDARAEIKRGRIAYADAYDDMCELAERSKLCTKHGRDFVYEDIAIELTAGGLDDEIDQRPAYAARVVSATELQAMRFDPVRYVLPGLIPDGLTILAAKPKSGKSWLMLDISIAVASGRYILGSLKPAEGDVLYLALEDSRRRLQRRMDKLLGAFADQWPQRLEIATEWSRGAICVADLEAWCIAHPRARLIVIDTFEKVRAAENNARGGRPYALDYEAIGPLHRLAHEHGIAIVLVTHQRKMEASDVFDTVSGTLGLTGAADTTLVLQRQSGGVTLHATGRDIEDSETAMQFDRTTCRWTVVGTLGGAADVRMSDERRRVLQVLADAGEPLSSEQIRRGANLKSRNTADVLLGRMVEAGQVVRAARGKYDLPDRVRSDRSDRSDRAGGGITH
jgi:hypothetical protein